jgi:phosphate starvation-inducible PhoH-like protein
VEHAGDTIVFSVTGKPIVPRSENQLKLVKEFERNDMLFAIGPAGSGKTYTAIALAVRALKNKEIKKIILSRPAVEAGEKLGFLPGDMKDKIDPYLQPLYDALQDMIPAAKLKEYMELNVIQIAPLAFMRGRTLNDAVVILDEAQNTTTQQIKMFLTRMGMNTKMIVTGDMTQIDLPSSQTSGLVQALRILKGVKGIAFIEMNKKDIVRHKLVTKIVEAYEKFDKQQREAREAAKEEAREKKNQ